MKKMTVTLMTLFTVLILSSNVFAYEILSTAGTDGKLEVGGVTTGSAALEVGLSPKVVAIYFTDGTTQATAQWYAIGAVHPGGNEIFGTAQNLTNTYSKGYLTGTAINSGLYGLPTGPDSDSEWVTNGWEL